MENRRQKLVPFAVMAVCLVAVLVLKPRGASRGETAEPESVVYKSVEYAQQGDVQGYLSCFCGELLDQFQTAAREGGREAFRAGLQGRASQIAGIAVTREVVEDERPDVAVLRVESVYRTRNEVQTVRVRRNRGRWQIEKMGAATTVEMPIPYGTPVIPVGNEEPAPPAE